MLQSMGVLQNLNNVPVDMTLSGLDALTNAQQMDAFSLQDRQRKLDFDTANDPLLLERQRLDNEGALARLPGIQADSEIKQRESKKQAIMFDDEIAELRKQYSDNDIKRYIQGINQLGGVFRNAAEFAFQNPLGAATRAREMLTQAGGAEFWNPDWDKLPPEQLAQRLSEIGKAMQENEAGYSKALDLASIQAQSAELRKQMEVDARQAVELEKTQRAAQAAQLRHQQALELVERRAQLNQKPERQPRDYQELAVRHLMLSQQAELEGDIQTAQRHKQQAEELYLLAEGLRSAAARTAAGGQVDTEQLGVPTRRVPGPVQQKADPLGIR